MGNCISGFFGFFQRCCTCCNYRSLQKCWNAECCQKCLYTDFATRFFPEWQIMDTWKEMITTLLIAVGLTIFFTLGSWSLDEYVFDTGSTITVGTIVALSFFFLMCSLLLVVYAPWQHQLFPTWIKVSVVVIYVGFGGFLIIFDLIGQTLELDTDSNCFDIWTIVHFLAGPFFAFLLPFNWCFLVVTLWECMEAGTKGLGDSEVFCNRVVDIVVALIGWWCIVPIWCRCVIPWCSAKHAYDQLVGVKGSQLPADDNDEDNVDVEMGSAAVAANDDVKSDKEQDVVAIEEEQPLNANNDDDNDEAQPQEVVVVDNNANVDDGGDDDDDAPNNPDDRDGSGDQDDQEIVVIENDDVNDGGDGDDAGGNDDDDDGDNQNEQDDDDDDLNKDNQEY